MTYESTENNRGQELIKLADKAFQTDERRNAEATWAELAEFILPGQNSGFFGDNSKGIRRDRRLYDSTAIQANRDLASAMHSTVTNPALKWSQLRFRDDKINDTDDGAEWLSTVTKTVHNTLNDSNFDGQIGRCYQSFSGLGNMLLYHEEQRDAAGRFNGFRFYAWHLAEVALCENAQGTVDRCYRKFKMTASQAVEKFGDALGQDVVEKAKQNPLEDMDFYHCIYPREPEQIELGPLGQAADPRKRPVASDYVMCKGSKLVKEEGYYEFPVYIGRWSNLPGEVYGNGPGKTALPDVRTLNALKEQTLKAMAKTVNPPILTTKQNMFSGDLRPGHITTVRSITDWKEMITQSRFDVTHIQAQDLRESIKSSFYIDKLLLPPRTETGEMTAYEVAQRLEQMQQILGPVLSKLNSEFLTLLVMRCVAILNREGKLPPLPESMQANNDGSQSIDFEVMFVNSLARSQQMSELRNVQAWIQEMSPLAQAKPEILDNVNADAFAKYTARTRNIPEELLTSDKELKGIRDGRAKQQQMASAMQMGEGMANIAKGMGGKQ